MTITQSMLKALRADINAALVEVGKKHGANIAAGNCTFGDTTATFKLSVVLGGSPEGGAGEAMKAKAASDWNRYGFLLGVPHGWLHKVFDFGGKTYRVEGYLPRSQRFPYLCSTGDKLVKLSGDHLRAGIKE